MVQDYKEVMKNPTWKEYFKVKEVDGYVRGFYDHITDDVWIWKGEVLHTFIREYVEIQYHTWKFILETDRFTIPRPMDGRERMINKLKVLEPNSKEEKGWLN